MFVKPCPKCGRKPKIQEGKSRNGHRFYMIGCPNYCYVLRPDLNDYWNNYGGFGFMNRSRLCFNENIDHNAMYKKWNEELIE